MLNEIFIVDPFPAEYAAHAMRSQKPKQMDNFIVNELKSMYAPMQHASN